MTKQDNIEKVSGTLWEVFRILVDLPGISHKEAFKVVFALFVYKRFSDVEETLKKYSWDELMKHPREQFFIKLEESFEILVESNNAGEEFVEKLNIKQIGERITSEVKDRLISVFTNMQFDLTNYEVTALADGLIERYSTEFLPDVYENKSLDRLAVTMLGFDRDQEIWFPGCGFGNIVIEAWDEVADGLPSYLSEERGQGFDKHASVADPDFWVIVILRMLLAGVPLFQDIWNNNSFFDLSEHDLDWSDLKLDRKDDLMKRVEAAKSDLFYEPGPSEKLITAGFFSASVMFFISPFSHGSFPKAKYQIDLKGNAFRLSHRQSELYYLLWSLKHLKKRGQLGIVLPAGMLYKTAKNYRTIRKFLIEEDILQTIVELPDGLFHRPTPKLAMIILNVNKQNNHSGKYAFATVKAAKKNGISHITDDSIKRAQYVSGRFRSLLTNQVISREDIQKAGYDLRPSRYLGTIGEKIRKIRESEAGRQLSAVSKIARGTKGVVVKQKCIIIPFSDAMKTPTIFDPEKGGPSEYSLRSHEFAIFPKEDVINFEYLYYQLSSRLVQTQVEEIVAGIHESYYPMFLMDKTWEDVVLPKIKRIIIPMLENISEQQTFAYQQDMEFQKVEFDRLETEKTIKKKEDEKKEAEFQIVKHLGHSLNRRIGNVQSIMSHLARFIDRRGLSQEALQEIYFEGQVPIVVEEKIQEALSDLSRMHGLIAGTRELVTKRIGDKSFKVVDIRVLFESHILAKYKNSNFKITLDCPQGIKVRLDESSFIEAIDNLISNAEKHAFKEPATDPEVFFWVRDYEDRIVIDCANNGTEFPPDMVEDEFLEFGIKGKSSDGTGLGGAYVKLMLEAHKAELEIKRRSGYGTYFRITIPKENYNE